MEGIIGLRLDGTVLSFAESLQNLTGYSAEEVKGRRFASLFPPELSSGCAALLGGAAVSGAVIAHGTTMLCKDGRTAAVYMSIYPLRGRSGDLYSYMVTVNAERDTAVPAFFTPEFHKIFEFSNDAVAVTDKTGSIIEVNQAFLDTYGYTREEAVGKNPRILKSRHSTKEMYEKMWSDIMNPEKGYWRGEIINVAKDGREIPALLSINAIKDGSGAIRNFMGIAFDLSGEKELERLNRMYMDYVVHDMRGPLTAIITNADMLLLQLKDSLPERHRGRLEMIISSAERVSRMARDMMDFEKMHAGNISVNREDVRFGKVFSYAFAPFERANRGVYMNGKRYVDGIVDFDIRTDAGKLQRILYNLLANAFKHSVNEVRIEASCSRGELTVTISDDGKGIASDEAGRIFDTFYQSNGSIRLGGAGLGLNIVKAFVGALGGSVWFSSEPGSGAAFGFKIPV